MLNEVYTSVEEGLFNMETESGKPEIFLKPKDKVHVPFKYLTFGADHSVNPQVNDWIHTKLLSLLLGRLRAVEMSTLVD